MPQLPPTYAGTEITVQNNENLKGEMRGTEGMESLFIFCDHEMANFQQSYPGKSFVNCFNKSKTWYKTEDSRFLLGLLTFFSCHLSQDRISPLEV